MSARLFAWIACLGVAACGDNGDSSLFGGRGGSAAATPGDASANAGGASSAGGGNTGGGASGSGGTSSAAGSGGTFGSGSTSAGGAIPGDAGGSRGAPDAASDSSAGGRRNTGGTKSTGGAPAGGAGGNPPASGGKPGTGGAGGGTDGGPSGGTPTPGVIECAGQPCTIAGTPTNVCCLAPAPFPTSCLPSFPGCAVEAGIAYACDDAADCTNGAICCAGIQGASCAKNCSNGTVQLCRTNAECKSGQCRPDAQHPEYDSCQ